MKTFVKVIVGVWLSLTVLLTCSYGICARMKNSPSFNEELGLFVCCISLLFIYPQVKQHNINTEKYNNMSFCIFQNLIYPSKNFNSIICFVIFF